MKKAISLLVSAFLLASGLPALAAAPDAPTALNLSAITATSITVNWNASASSSAVGYAVYRNSTSTPFATTASTTLTDSGLAPNTHYTYYVAAYDASSTYSALSAGVSATTLSDTSAPSIPTNLAAVAVSNKQINLVWTPSGDNVGVTGYRIYRNGGFIANTPLSQFFDTGLAASTTYAYSVASYDAAGNLSAQSATASATTLQSAVAAPSVPKNLTATAVSASRIDLSWGASTSTAGIAGYSIYRNGILAATASGTSYQDTGLSAGTSYTYTVAAFDTHGTVSAQSAPVTRSTLFENWNINARIAVKNGKGKVINLRSNDLVKLVIYSSESFDARTIDPATAAFGGSKTAGKPAVKDDNKDGRLDLILGFRAKNMTALSDSDNVAVFTAKTRDGKTVGAQTEVRVKNSSKPGSIFKKYQEEINRLKARLEAAEKRLKELMEKNKAQRNEIESEDEDEDEDEEVEESERAARLMNPGDSRLGDQEKREKSEKNASAKNSYAKGKTGNRK